MPSSLRSRLAELATEFSASVLDAIRGASLEELLSGSRGERARAPSRGPAPAKRGARLAGPRAAAPAPAPARDTSAATAAPAARRRGGRLARRSSGDIAGVVTSIVGLLKSSPAGLRAEEIRAKLGLQAKELPRPLKEGLDAGTLSKSGQKRATTYFVGGGGRKVTPRAARGGRAVAKRAARPKAKARPARAAGAKRRGTAKKK
jgi:hypothetical protein